MILLPVSLNPVASNPILEMSCNSSYTSETWKTLKPEELLRLPCYTSTSSLCGVSPYLPLIAKAPFTLSLSLLLGPCTSELSSHFFALLLLFFALLLLLFFVLL